jgi:hypothetical protein
MDDLELARDISDLQKLELARDICELQHRMGRLESTLFVHTSLEKMEGVLFTYLKYLRFVDGGKTFLFSPGSRVPGEAFRYHAKEWILHHYDAVFRINWDKEYASLPYFGLSLDEDAIVGLGY